jgi:hypothetical protein
MEDKRVAEDRGEDRGVEDKRPDEVRGDAFGGAVAG